MRVLCVVLLVMVSPLSADADVLFHDEVIVTGQSVMLRAKTGGRFFKRGGEIVEFFVDGEFLGRSLSGGDGIAYLEFTPKKEGRYEISVKSGADDAKGLVLSLRKDTEIVFIDVAGGLFDSILFRRPRAGSMVAVEKILKRTPVVYLNILPAGNALISEWLRKNEFPEAPVLSWQSGEVFSSMVDKGFKVKAVIGGPEVISSASEFDAELFTFQEAEDATEVNDWKEIEEALTNN